MTDEERLAIAVEQLTEWHLDSFGGYPMPGRWFGDVFVYCSTQGDTTKWDEIVAHRRSDLIEWVREAEAIVVEEKCAMWEAFAELEHPADVSDLEAAR